MDDALNNRPVTKAAFILVVVSFLLSTAVSLVSLHVMSQRNTREMNRVLATQVYDYIQNEISGPLVAARTMASNSYLVEALRNAPNTDEETFSAEMVRYLTGVEEGLGYQGAFLIVTSNNRYYTRNGFNRVVDAANTEADRWYTTFLGDSDSYDLDVDNDERNKEDLAVYVNVKVRDAAKNVLGVCGIGVRMTGIQELFRTFEQSFKVKINLVDPTGIVQVDTDTSRIETASLYNHIADTPRGDYVYNELGGNSFAITKYVDDLDWYLVVQSDGASEAGQFANVIMLNVLLCVFVLAVLFVALHLAQRRTEALRSVSLVDHATNLPNKRAFEHDKATRAARGLEDDLVCLTADVNGLKTVNDTLGHDAGDELICGAADCLQEVFGERGKVYRIGGDEFAGMFYAAGDEFKLQRERFEETVAKWTGDKVEGVSVSCGYASVAEFPGLSINDLFKCSDKRMYEEKQRHYERTGQKRRT